MPSLLSTRRRPIKRPRRVSCHARGSAALCKLPPQACAGNEKSATTSLAHHKKNRPPRCNRNQQYSITALTDGGGSIVERYAYTAYGQVTFADASGTVQTASASNNRYTYTGREWDEGLNLYHFRARMYDAIAGRFVSRDPIGYFDGVSLYCRYFSTFSMDPSGTRDWRGLRPRPVPQTERDEIASTVGVINAALAWGCVQQAQTATMNDPGQWGGIADALRHCTWTCCMSRRFGARYAAQIADIHERWSPPPNLQQPPPGYATVEEWQAADTAMDEHNNSVGIQLGLQRLCDDDGKPMSCEDKCRDALASGSLVINAPLGYPGSAQQGPGGYY